MAAPMIHVTVYKIFVFSLFFVVLLHLSIGELNYLTVTDIETITKNSCVVITTEYTSERAVNLVNNVRKIFQSGKGQQTTFVEFGRFPNVAEFCFSNGFGLESMLLNDKKYLADLTGRIQIMVFRKRMKDNTCLLRPKYSKERLPDVDIYVGPYSSKDSKALSSLLHFINSNCETFYTLNGSVSEVGQLRDHVRANLFRPQSKSATKTEKNMGFFYADARTNPFKYPKERQQSQPNSDGHCSTSDASENCLVNDEDNLYTVSQNHDSEAPALAECDEVSKLDWETFFRDYLLKSKPVIIKGAAKNWPAVTKWTNEFLLKTIGDRNIHVKIADHGRFEGCEKGTKWEGFNKFFIPPEVKEQLPFPDLVVVRPAAFNINFKEFMRIMTSDIQVKNNVSAYIEYASLKNYMPNLVKDVEEMSFLTGHLPQDEYLKHLNVWLSDGNTLGKLHFDPFENFLCQVSGKKQLILFDPHNNSRLYEGHIQEAELKYDHKTKRFSRSVLKESTALVMSPVDILEPDFKRFPLFGDAVPLNCTIEEGDVLYMPSFWWHEVQSFPNTTLHRNMAVNFWYKPFLTKPFPCPQCPLDINREYLGLLEKYLKLAKK